MMVIGAAIPADPPVHVAFSGEHGYPLGVFPKGFADDHPLGEGNERDDLWFCAHCEHPAYSDDEPTICHECGWMGFRKAHRYILIECKRSQVPELWQEQQSEQRLEREGDTDIWRVIDSVSHEEVRLFLPGLLIAPPPRIASKHIPLRKLDLDAHRGVRKKVTGARLPNVYSRDSMRLVDGGPFEFAAETRTLDTFRNAILTVGDGKTYAAIQAGGITNASTGDVVAVYAGGAANVYTETINDGAKSPQLIGMVADQGLKITQSSGALVTWQGSGLVANFEIEGTGTATTAVQGNGCILRDIVASGGSAQAVELWDGYAVNSVAHSSGANGWYNWIFRVELAQCTAIGNTGAGFITDSISVAHWAACLSSGNTGEDFDTTQTPNKAWGLVSEDATAMGGGAVTGFDPSDLENTWQIKAAVAGSTKAKLNGYPYDPLDALAQTRKREGILYAGASDPDPASIDFPAESDVRLGVDYDNANLTGDVRVPPIEKVELGYDYDTNDTLTGTLGGAAHAIPVLTASDDGNNSSFTVSITGDGGATHNLFYRGKSSDTWTSGSTRVGDGDITVSAGPGTFEYYAYSSGSDPSPPSAIGEVEVEGATVDKLGPGQARWKFEKYNEATGTWSTEGNYPAPIQQQPLRDGRSSTMDVLSGSDGEKMVIRRPQRSQLGSTRMKWFRETSGADYAIYEKLLEWEKTGAGIRITRHDDVIQMGYFRSAHRKVLRSLESAQEYEPVAVFEEFAVDGTGAGW